MSFDASRKGSAVLLVVEGLMKHADKNEFDLMLRGLAKRERAVEEHHHDEAHLDTDELNAYAEDVLPSATRARYTAHIADCARCRQIVSQLALSAGAAVQEAAPAKAVRSFWAMLAEFFSPTVLKYAAPALAFIAIGLIGLVVWNNRRKPEFIAQNQPTPSALSTPIDQVSESRTNDRLESNVEKPRVDDSRKQPLDRGTPSNDSSTAAGRGAQKQPTDLPAEQRQYAPEPSIAAAPPPKPATTEANKNEPATRREAQAEDQERKRRDESEAERSKETAQISKGEYGKGQYGKGEYTKAPQDKDSGSKTDSIKAGVAGGVSKMRVGKGERSADEETETRSVSGKQFRREGSTWFDTSYDSSRPTINIKRGSDQYRALIADEPAIRNIAEALSGTVIVVWKGRAYRIY